MATLGTIKVANITQYEREGMVTVVMPLPKDALSVPIAGTDAVMPDITAEDPMLDAVDRRVQWYPLGPNYKVANKYRNIRIQFPVRIPAGLPPADATRISNGWADYPYPFYYERDIVITDAIGTRTPFAIHPQVIQGLLQGAGTNYVKFFWNTNISRIQVEIPFDLIQGIFKGGFQAPVQEFDREEDPTDQNVRSWRVRSRMYPEDFGLPVSSTASFWIELMYEIWSGMPYVPFWLSYGNSMITTDGTFNAQSDPSRPQFRNGNVKQTLSGPVKLRVEKNSATTSIVPRYRNFKIPNVAAPSSTVDEITLIDPYNDVTHNSFFFSIATTPLAIETGVGGVTINSPNATKLIIAQAPGALSGPLFIELNGVTIPAGAPDINGRHYIVEQAPINAGNPNGAIFYIRFVSTVQGYTGGTGTIKYGGNSNRHTEFADGNAQVIEGMILFEGGTPSALELTTFDAEKDQNGDAPILAMSNNWADTDKASYGPFGNVVPRPGELSVPANAKISDDATAFRWACEMAVGHYDQMSTNNGTHTVGDPWSRNELYGVKSSGSPTGDIAGYSVTFHPWARSGCPDTRSMTMALYQEFCRARHFKEWDVRNFNPSEHRDNGSTGVFDSRFDTLVFYWPERVYYPGVGQKWIPEADNLGKRASGSSTNHPRTNLTASLEWGTNDHAHQANNMPCYAIQLTGNKFGLFGLLPHLQATVLCRKPHNYTAFLNRFNDPAFSGIARGHNAVYDYSKGRDEARVLHMVANIYNLTDDQRLLTKMQSRLDYFEGNIASNPGPRFITSFALPAGQNYNGTGYFSQYPVKMLVQDAANGAKPFLGGRATWTTWMEGLLTRGFWGIIKMFRNSTDPVHLNVANRYEDVLVDLAESLTLYGMTDIRFGTPGDWSWMTFINMAWGGMGPLRPLTKSGQQCAFIQTNPPCIDPASGFHYVNWFGTGFVTFGAATFLIGYDLAVARQKTAWATRCKSVIETTLQHDMEGAVGAAGSGQPTPEYGWSNPGGTLDHHMIMYDPYRSRTLSNKTASVIFTGSGSVTVAKTLLMSIEILGSGTLDATPVKAGGGIHTTIVFQGTGFIVDFDPIVHTVVSAPPVEINGSGSVLATATKISSPSVHQESVTFNGSGSVTALYRRVRITFVNSVPLGALYEISKPIRVREPMPKENVNFSLYSGNHFELQVNIVDVNGEPVDITAATQIEWVMQPSVSDATGRIYKRIGDGITTGTSINQFLVEILPTDTLGLEGQLYHEAEIELDGKDTTVMVGSVDVRPSAID